VVCLRGVFVVENRKSGRRSRAYGVITRTLPKVIAGLMYPKREYTGSDAVTVTVKDVRGNSKTVYTAGRHGLCLLSGGWGFVQGWTTGGYCNPVAGVIFKVGKGTPNLSPDALNLSDVVQEVNTTAPSVIEQTDKTVVVVTGSGTAAQDFTCTEVGVFMWLLSPRSESDLESFESLIDIAGVNNLQFAVGDPISIQYKLVFS